MKKFLLLLAILFCSLTTSAQYVQVTDNISKIRIKSIKPMVHDPRLQTTDTIYICIKSWNYDTSTSKYNAIITDYVKVGNVYKSINEKNKQLEKAEVDTLFTTLNNSILPTESYSTEMDKLLTMALLIDTKNNLLEGGKTVYGGEPNDWEIPEE